MKNVEMKKGSELMPQLICAKDIEDLQAQGKQTMYFEEKTIITPAARDRATALGIQFIQKKEAPHSLFDSMDSEKVYKVLKVLMERGMLGDILKPYQAQTHESGFKVVRGDTVSMEILETGTVGTKAFYQEVVNEGAMQAGFLTIENSSFDWEIANEEINYIIEGTVTIQIDKENFTANVGDILYFPKGTKVTWSAQEKMKLFYTTC
jgi:Ethanolamine utilization protein